MCLIPWSTLLFITMFFGSESLIPVKLARIIIQWAGFLASAYFSEKKRYTLTHVAITFWFGGIGIVNAYNLKTSGADVSLNSDPTELIGSDNTTILYICFMFLSNKHLYSTFVLTPIYIAANIAMLVSVQDNIEEAEDQKANRAKMISVIWRFVAISGATLFAQYFLVLQQTELFYKNRIMKLQ